MPPTGNKSPAATEIAPPDIAGYRFASAPVHQDAKTLTFEGRERASRRRVLATVPRSSSDLAVVQRLRREAGLLRSLQHPNIVGLHPGTVPVGADVLMRKHIAGPSLAEWMAEPTHVPLDGEQVCRLAGDIAAALDFAQAQGVVHGDVRPENILLPPHGPARLIGFGSEAHNDADARADVYGLAATVYYVLTGAPPGFQFPPAREEGGGAWLYTLTSASPFRAPALTRPDGAPATAASLDPYLINPRESCPDLPPAASDVIGRGLAVDPQDRFASAGEFSAALGEAWEGDPTLVGIVSYRRAFPLRVLGGLAGAAAMLGAGLWLGLQANRLLNPVPVRLSALEQGTPRRKKPARLAHPRLARKLGPPPSVFPADPSESIVPDLLAPGVPEAAAWPFRRHGARLRHRPAAARRIARTKRHAPRTAPPPVAFLPVPAPAVPKESAWLQVTARQAVNASASRPFVANIHAEQISLDGRPLSGLTKGGWVRVAPGPHRLSFYPPTDGPFAPNANLRVDLPPRSRRHVQVPLPRRVAEDTVVGGLAHFGDTPGIMKSGTEGRQNRGDDTDDSTSTTSRRAPAGRGGL